MRPKELVLICLYSEEGSAAEIVLRSFDIFVEKELQNVAERP